MQRFELYRRINVSKKFRLTFDVVTPDVFREFETFLRKVKDGRPVTVRVPLNSIAKEILERYKDLPFDELLPLISQQKYNVAIKKMFLAAGLTRPVVVYNPTTSEQEIRPLNEVASSHLSRRCFVGNLSKQVKDPNPVGALSGHKEGRVAIFAGVG